MSVLLFEDIAGKTEHTEHVLRKVEIKDYNIMTDVMIDWLILVGKEQALDADPKVMQQINVTGNLDQAGNTAMFLFLRK